jgi:hypothetical protein
MWKESEREKEVRTDGVGEWLRCNGLRRQGEVEEGEFNVRNERMKEREFKVIMIERVKEKG